MGACGSKPPLDVNAKGQLVGDPDFGTLKRLKSKVKQLQKATKKAAAQVHPDGAGPSEEGGDEASDLAASDLANDLQALKLFEALVVIKQELHDEPKPSGKDYLPEPTTAIAEMRTLIERLRSLQDRAIEKNVYTMKERELLSTRLALVERCVTAKEEMLEAAQRKYTAQQTVPELRAHQSGLEGVIQAALTRNEDVMTTVKLTRWETVKKSTSSSDRRKDWVQRTTEYARLAGVLSCVRLMADSKEAMAAATAQGTQVGDKTGLGPARATLDLMTKCLDEAAVAKTQDAPEVPPLKTQIARVGPIVAAKQEVHDSTVAPVNGKMTVEHLRGPVTQRMLTAKQKAEAIKAWGGPEAKALERRLLYVEEMAAAKIACREGMKHRVDPMMTSGELRAVVQTEHMPRLSRGKKAGVADSPEYADLSKRMKWATGMANSKDEMELVMAAVVDAETDLADVQRALKNLRIAVENAKGVRLETTPQFGKCKARRDEVEGIYRLKHAVHVAAQGGDPQDSIAHLRGRVTSEMETARNAAMQGGAYGGDVKRELEYRLAVVHNMANGKELAHNALQSSRSGISANYSIEVLDGERSKLSEFGDEVKGMHAAGSPEHEALCDFVEEIGRWIEIKREAQETLKKAKSALKADLSGQVAFLAGKKIERCTRGNVVGQVKAKRWLDGQVMVHPVNHWGYEKKEQKSDGSEVPMERKVPRKICIKGSIEEVNDLRRDTKSAITACERIGAKGETEALNDVLHTLDDGRSKIVNKMRDVVHAKFTAYPAPERNWQPVQVPVPVQVRQLPSFGISADKQKVLENGLKAASVGWEAVKQGDSKGMAALKAGAAFVSSL